MTEMDNGKVSVVGVLNASSNDQSDILKWNDNFVIKYASTLDKNEPEDCTNDSPFMDKTGNKLLDIFLSSNLEIVNGRIGDDAGIRSYKFMSTTGNSIISSML